MINKRRDDHDCPTSEDERGQERKRPASHCRALDRFDLEDKAHFFHFRVFSGL